MTPLEEAELELVALNQAAEDAVSVNLAALAHAAREFIDNPDNEVACRTLVRAALLFASSQLFRQATTPTPDMMNGQN